jgi:hypothetical protein
MIRLSNQNITQSSKINHRFDDTISFWYYNHDDRQSYYFKECDSFSAFKEVLVSRLITSLHYPCVKYQMATFIDQKIYNGVVSPNFIKPNTKYYSGSEILYNYYYGSDTPAMMVNPNSLESIWFNKIRRNNAIIYFLVNKSGHLIFYARIMKTCDKS